MKRPDSVIMWLHVEKQKSDFVNHLEKPLYDYTIKVPTWIGLAYKPMYAKIEIQENPPCWNDRRSETNHEEVRAYVKSNWMKKLIKMRKLNHNYMQVTVHGRSEAGFLSHEDYKNYHRELAELNEKYLGEPRKPDKKRSPS